MKQPCVTLNVFHKITQFSIPNIWFMSKVPFSVQDYQQRLDLLLKIQTVNYIRNLDWFKRSKCHWLIKTCFVGKNFDTLSFSFQYLIGGT